MMLQKFKSVWRNNLRVIVLAYAAVFLLSAFHILIATCVFGCASTVTPRTVQSTQASWDGNKQNSGFIGFNPDGSARITSNARDRYNGLIKIYGASFVPPLRPDAGISPYFLDPAAGDYTIDAQHLEYFITLSDLKKEPSSK